MEKISSGISALDRLIDYYHVGDNVVWEIDAGVPFDKFIKAFIRQSISDNSPVIYISFNRSPQTLYKELIDIVSGANFILIDCFTSGKGKNDETFARFYNEYKSFKTIRFNNPSDIVAFKNEITSIEDTFPVGARYIFDSLTGMQDLWGNEEDTYRLFTFMCPRLYDLETVAYWILEKDAHSPIFRANLKHITQIVFELYRRRDRIYIKANKLFQRELREIFKPHQVRIQDEQIDILSTDKPKQFYIGDILRDLRTNLNMSQKEIAERLNVTPSFISQLESNQISPSIHTLLEICNAMNVSPSVFLRDYSYIKPSSYTIVKSVEDNSTNGCREFDIITGERLNAKRVVISKGAELVGGITYSKKQELVYVISGTLTVELEEKVEVIKKGDCLFLRDVLPRKIINKGGEDAEFLVVW
ncbi:MAG: helix-turn-helix domain-containing protein [Thermodesulfovibrionales bacterium]|nr:helix-turn-helix domain-containing protein [Thermodesulfovibrionales bacterium]